jgi:DNA gyrase subunit A
VVGLARKTNSKTKSGRGRKGQSGGALPFHAAAITDVPLHDAVKSRYLNYALSVITARALPDVRDGLKPVQRRIIFTMGQQGIRADSKHRKCAKVVGDVMGNYHPHGDGSIYEALVRMAQSFSLRQPLVDGSGNFGSMDGDGAAAMRYTECRLSATAEILLQEISEDTVDFRPNYDGTKEEPIVLPARQPNLLINGSTGIAVGMATNIPPHNPLEVIDALLKLLKNRETTLESLCRIMLGPDFPTGGEILSTPEELVEIYRTGAGPVRVRGKVMVGESSRSGDTLIIHSIPYGQNKATLVERIADVVQSKKLPDLVDVRDLSGEDVRVELTLRRQADSRKVLAYLYKNTPLQQNFNVNMTCLVPTANPEVGRPERCDLKTMLTYFLGFRMEVVTRRLEHELAGLLRRLHILEGFYLIFDALDEILAIIRKSEGKSDAAQKIMARFPIDAEQTDAILELKLYRLARLEINILRKEGDEKRARAAEIESTLKDESLRWKLVEKELRELKSRYEKDPSAARVTTFADTVAEPEFAAEDFIIDEDQMVVVSADGWYRRQREVKEIQKLKLREGDRVLAVEPGSTRATLVLFSNMGMAYSLRIADVPATAGFGEPVQKRFSLKDGERIVQAMSLDPRWIGDIETEGPDGPPHHAVAVTSDGLSMRFSLASFLEPSTRSGRRFMKARSGAEVLRVVLTDGTETLIAVTAEARAMICPVASVSFLSGPGQGVMLIKLGDEDRVLGFIASSGDRDLLTVETNRGATKTVSTAKYEVSGRGGRGRELQKNGSLVRVVEPEIVLPEPLS